MPLKNYTYGTVRKFSEDVEDTRTVEFVISSSAKDRHRSIVNMDGWALDNFNRNPIVGYQHNVYGGNMCTPDDPDDVIGSGRAWIESDTTRDANNALYKLLVGSVTFEKKEINPKAEKIFRKVLAGTLRATSVGFMEVGKGEWKKDVGEDGKETEEKTYHFKGQELLEFSIVNIPSNPEAVGRSLQVQEDWVMQFIQRYMPESMSIKDIKEMKVRDVIDLLHGNIVRTHTETGSTIDKKALDMRLRIIGNELKLKSNV